MVTARPSRSTHGATLPEQADVTPGVVERGFWFEALSVELGRGVLPQPRELRMHESAQAAVRAIRIQVRTLHVASINPAEIFRSLEWADRGCIQAIAALHRGEACGFTLITQSGVHLEWSVRPVNYLSLIGAACTHIPPLPSPRAELNA